MRNHDLSSTFIIAINRVIHNNGQFVALSLPSLYVSKCPETPVIPVVSGKSTSLFYEDVEFCNCDSWDDLGVKAML